MAMESSDESGGQFVATVAIDLLLGSSKKCGAARHHARRPPATFLVTLTWDQASGLPERWYWCTKCFELAYPEIEARRGNPA